MTLTFMQLMSQRSSLSAIKKPVQSVQIFSVQSWFDSESVKTMLSLFIYQLFFLVFKEIVFCTPILRFLAITDTIKLADTRMSRITGVY